MPPLFGSRRVIVLPAIGVIPIALSASLQGAVSSSALVAGFLSIQKALAGVASSTSMVAGSLAAAVARAVTGALVSGDSIVRGFGLSNASTQNFGAQWATLTGLPYYNDGVDGKKLAAIDADWATSGNAARYNAAALNTYVQEGGCNDLRAGESSANLQTYIQSLCGKAKAAGFATWVCTILPETGYPGWGSAQETQRTTYNTWLRNNYTSFADGLIDFAAIPEMQDTTNTTNYQDNLHPTATGAGYLARAMQSALANGASTAKQLAGTSAGQSVATGALSGSVGLTGTSAGTSVATGALTTSGGASPTVQWSGTDKNAAITKTSATRYDRTSTAGGTWASIRSDTSKSSGLRYVEFTVNISASDGLIVGFANATEVLTNYMGQSANSIGAWSSGTVVIGPSTQNTGFGTWAPGDVIAVLLDFTNKTFSAKRNASAWSSPMSITTLASGALFVGGTAKSNAELPAITANFGDAAFVYTPPNGAVAWNAA